MAINFAQTRKHLNDFLFGRLFVEELGWSLPTSRQTAPMNVGGATYQRRQIAQLAGAVVLEVSSADGQIPDAKARAAIHKEISKLHHENLLIFVDKGRTQSLWYWVKRQNGKTFARDHYYIKGQPGDLFISKLSGMVFDLSEFDETGNVSVVEVASRLKSALDVQRVTKQFYGEFEQQHLAFIELIEGIKHEHDRRWYASVLLNRLMFIYFLQRKFFLDNGDGAYLQHKLAASKEHGKNLFYSHFMRLLFFEGFAKPDDKRSPEAKAALGSIKYLNGGLFLPHTLETKYPNIRVPDSAFENLFGLFQRYSWNLNDAPGGEDNEINPDVLGYIFEKYINQKAFGAYYTRPEITEYLCERTIHQLILDAINLPDGAPVLPGAKARRYESMADLLMDLDAQLCTKLLIQVLPLLSLLDPACGSGAFLVAAMKTLINIYSAVVGRVKFLNNKELSTWLAKTEREHKNIAYFIKKRIITDNLYGVDIMEEATEIARLRLFLALVASAETVDQLEPLPNVDFNILAGNSLIGLMRVDDKEFDKRNLFRKSYKELLEEKNKLIDSYRHTDTYGQYLSDLRDGINKHNDAARATLDEILLDTFTGLGIKYEQATWDVDEGQEGKPGKRPLKLEDMRALNPFHWGYEFDHVLNQPCGLDEATGQRGGFDAIITNPPWEIFKPNAKEFFEDYSDQVSKKKMTIHEFEAKQAEILGKDSDVRAAWLKYLSSYPHVSAFYRSAPQYRNQISIVNGKKAGSDTNLYKLFVEQCFNLLRPGGQCGIVIPSGIYTDLGSKQLRQMLFECCQVTGLFCVENRRMIFENVDSRFKFVVLTFNKGGKTTSFPAAFMRHDVAELERFPGDGGIEISVELVKRLSPDSLSVTEFKNEMDVRIAEKMLRFPLLGETITGKWNVRFTSEFHMTNDSGLFKSESAKGRMPLYEGKMIWQFHHELAAPRYWVDGREGRAALVGRGDDAGRPLDYQAFRVGFRDIASNTNERTMVSSIIPPAFHGNKIPTVRIFDECGKRNISGAEQCVLCAALNSYTVDYLVRMKVTTTLNFFYVYQLPVPRLTANDKAFGPIVERTARLICTTPEFDDLAKSVGLKSHRDGVTDPAKRAMLRAELDGLIAHLYGLTEEEFAYILTTFPLVPDPVKVAAHNAYRDVARGAVR